MNHVIHGLADLIATILRASFVLLYNDNGLYRLMASINIGGEPVRFSVA